MKKTAKQMFEELGFKYNRAYDEYLESENIFCTANDWCLNSSTTYIHFFIEDKIFNIATLKHNGNAINTDITLPLLQAINKQMEELGWGKEGE